MAAGVISSVTSAPIASSMGAPAIDWQFGSPRAVCPRSQTYQASCLPRRATYRTRKCLPHRPQTARPCSSAAPSRGGDARASSYAAAVALEDSEILLKSLPTDVAGMSIRNASEPVAVLALSLDRLLAVDGPPVLPASVRVGSRISRIVQRAHRRRCGQRPEDDRVADAESRWKVKPFVPKHLHRLACRAHARKGFEEIGNRFPDLCVGVEHDVAGFVVDASLWAEGNDTRRVAPC